MSKPNLVVVWGNCQAEPLGALLREPLAHAGLEVVDVPPVFLATEAEIAHVHDLVRHAAFLVSQSIREEYRFGGCGTTALASELPEGGRLVTISNVFHAGPFPYLVNAHGADGARVNAPITDYHDLRAVRAASLGLDVDAAVAWWPAPSADAVRAGATQSIDRMRQREDGLDVVASDVVGVPDALWSMDHPSNRLLGEIASRVLAVMGIDARIDVPAREYLAERRAPIEPAVVEALGWPASAARPEWVVRNERLDAAAVLAAHLEFYATRPDVVADTIDRYARGRVVPWMS